MMQQQSIVDRLHSDFKEVVEQLESNGEISLRNSAEEVFRKSLLLAAASYFERRVTDVVLEFISEASVNDDLVTEFVRRQAIDRRYHTLFAWNRQNANQFFGLFGADFGEYMKNYVANNPDYESAIRAFMEIGRERNRIVHEDFGSAELEKSTTEVHYLYEQALIFVEQIPLRFEEFLASRQSPDSE